MRRYKEINMKAKHKLLNQPDMIGFLNRAGIVLYNELPEGFSDKDKLSL